MRTSSICCLSDNFGGLARSLPLARATAMPSLVRMRIRWASNSANHEAQQIAQHVAQSRQRDILDRAQIDHEGAKVRPEWRARLQSLGRLGLEALGATRTDAAV